MAHHDARPRPGDGSAGPGRSPGSGRPPARRVRVPTSREPSARETAAVTQTVVLGGRVDVRSVGRLRTTLHAAIDAGHGPMRVDVAGLELGDDAALGVLLGAQRRARRCGRSMVVVGVPAGYGLHRLSRVLRVEDDTLLHVGPA